MQKKGFESLLLLVLCNTGLEGKINFLQIEPTDIIYNKPIRYNSGSIVFINNYKYALHVSDALCVLHQEDYKL